MEIKEKIDKLFLTLVEEKLILDDPKEKNVFIMNFVIFNIIMLLIMKVSVKKLLKLYSIPALFILTTLIPMFWIKGDVTGLMLRAFSSLSAAYFLVCSTPAADLDYIFEKLRFPKIFREMFDH